MNVLKRVVLITSAVVTTVACAQEGGIHLRTGVVYRDFDEVNFDDVDFMNWNGQAGGGPFGIQNAQTADPTGTADYQTRPGASNANLDYVKWPSQDSRPSNTSRWGPSLGLAVDIYQTERMTIGISSHIQYYSIEAGDKNKGNMASPDDFIARQYNHQVRAPGLILPVGPMQPANDPVVPFGTDFSSFTVDNEFDLDLYVFDLGVEARSRLSWGSLRVAAGPTLHIADAETTQKHRYTWYDAAGEHRQGPFTRSDEETKYLFGFYGAVSAAYDVTQSWAVAAEYRYDVVAGDAGDDLSSLDLDSSSGQIKLIYTY